MKFEHRKEKVASLRHFALRMGRYGLFALILITVSVMLGTIGYHYLADLEWLDSFYMACMILTGMGPVTDMISARAKLFSAGYALYSGITFLSITAVILAPIIHRILHILHVEDDETK